MRPCTTPWRWADATPEATVSKMAERVGGVEPVGRDALAEVPTGHQPAHHDGPVGLPPVVEERHDVGVLDPCDALGGGLEPPHELGMTDHPWPEDPHRDLPADRGLVGAMDLAELADADRAPAARTGHGALHRAGNWRRQTVDEKLGELGAEPVADELVDVEAGVEADDVEAPERLGGPARLPRRR